MNEKIVCLVKTKLTYNVKVKITGYYIFIKSKSTLGWEIIVAIKKKISSNVIEQLKIEKN